MGFTDRVAHTAYVVGLCASLGATGDATAQLPPVAVPPNAILPNYERMPLGQRESIEAGPFVARTNDAGANWYNPAGLAQHKESAVNASATAYEWTRMTLAGPGISTDRATFKTVGTFFGVLLGDPPSGQTVGAWECRSHDRSHGAPAGPMLPSASPRPAERSCSPFFRCGPLVAGPRRKRCLRPSWRREESHSLRCHIFGSDHESVADAVADRSTHHRVVADDEASHVGHRWNDHAPRLDRRPAVDLSTRATADLRIVSPGIQVWGSTRIKIQGSPSDGTSLADLAFRDESAEFKYAIPFQADVGLTVRFARGEIEADVHYHGSADQYVLYSSDTLAQATQVIGGTPPVVSSPPFTSTYAAVRAVANVAMAGNYRIGRLMRVHLGVLTDRSPVPTDSSSVFTKVDLYRVTSGFSLTGASLSGSIGLAYGWGRGDDRTLVVTAGGLPGLARLEVRTLNFIYALSYEF